MFISKQKLEKYYKILYGISLTIMFWIFGILFNYYKIVGGKLYYYVFISIGSFNLIYTVFYFIKMKRNKISIEKFLKPRIYDVYKKKQELVFFISVIVIIFIFAMPFFYVQGNLLFRDEEKEFQDVVFNLIKDSTNETEKINSILAWFNRDKMGTENFSNIYYRFRDDNVLLYFGDLFYFDKEPYICVRGVSEPYLIFISGSGRCGEYSHLFTEMGRIAGLNVSSINCPGENHAWNEVYLENNQTIIVDATAVALPRSTGIMSSDFMQKKVAGDWRELNDYPPEGNISYVFCKFPGDNTRYDVTERYTNIINITINVTDTNGNPLEDVVVKVISHNRPNWISSIGIDKITNESGQCTFKIGGGRYHFSFQRDGDWFPVETDVKWFLEDDEQQYYDYLYKPFSIFDNPKIILMIVIAILVIICLLTLRYKLPPRKNKDS